MKPVIFFPILLLAFLLGGCVYADNASETPKPVTRAVPKNSSSRTTETEDSSVDKERITGTFTLCVTAEEGVWLRSKPWATSALNIPNALLAGTKVEVYLSPYGAHEWLEVWVPSEGVTGYVNTNYVGSCKDD